MRGEGDEVTGNKEAPTAHTNMYLFKLINFSLQQERSFEIPPIGLMFFSKLTEIERNKARTAREHNKKGDNKTPTACDQNYFSRGVEIVVAMVNTVLSFGLCLRGNHIFLRF